MVWIQQSLIDNPLEDSAELMNEIWVFTGKRDLPSNNPTFPGGVFSSLELAEQWIERHQLSGTLTLYRLNTGAYDWALANGYFKPAPSNARVHRSFFGWRYSSSL